MKKFFIYFAGILLTLSLSFVLTGNQHIFKAIGRTYLSGHTGPTIDDYKIFENRIVKAGPYIEIPKSSNFGQLEVDPALMQKIESYEPVALLYIEHGEVIYEKYWEGYGENSLTNSFSAAKSIVGLSVLKAIELGLIQSVDQKVIDFVPELEGAYREEVTIRHLLTMTSGINFDESYVNPFGFMSKAYYGHNLLEKTLAFKAENKPGEDWLYLGGNTILLSIIVNRVTKISISDFVSREIWSKLGSPNDALWSLDDKDGMEKAYCCFYTDALDFSRLGLLVLNNGQVFGQKILDSNLLSELKKPVMLNNGSDVMHYGWHFWRIQYNNIEAVYARGIQGQYIISIPEYDMVIVRLGKKRGDKDEFQQPADVYHYLDLAKLFFLSKTI